MERKSCVPIITSSLGGNRNFRLKTGNRFKAKTKLQMMGAFAEFERNIIKKRQAEGIAKAKERGVYAARKRTPTINRETVKTLREQGLSTYKIADKMGISRMSVHRILKEVAA